LRRSGDMMIPILRIWRMPGDKSKILHTNSFQRVACDDSRRLVPLSRPIRVPLLVSPYHSQSSLISPIFFIHVFPPPLFISVCAMTARTSLLPHSPHQRPSKNKIHAHGSASSKKSSSAFTFLLRLHLFRDRDPHPEASRIVAQRLVLVVDAQA
jgi:hypothetical protein